MTVTLSYSPVMAIAGTLSFSHVLTMAVTVITAMHRHGRHPELQPCDGNDRYNELQGSNGDGCHRDHINAHAWPPPCVP
jgi:hypothetical protein